MKIKIGKIIENTVCEGPGNRFCIWVQGCSLRCEECANKAFWDFDGGKEYDVREIIERVRKRSNELEGVTVLGGEPFEQIEALVELLKGIKNFGMTSIVFTGYEYVDLLKKKDKKVENALKYIDVLIDGKFEKEMFELRRPWVGSSNQHYIFLSDYYKNFSAESNRIEIRIRRDGRVDINGMADVKEIDSWF